MELIDREKLIADIRTINEESMLGVDDCIDIIQEQPTVNTWISVEDRYPLPRCKGEEHSIEIIARDKYGKCRNCVYWFEHDIFEEEDGTILENIVAYMPIPEYKESE